MVRPAGFGYNKETAADNYFQQEPVLKDEELQQRALHEFDRMVLQLRARNIDVMVAEDNSEIKKPDAIFPNNWFSTTADGGLHIFPMHAQNRRNEKTLNIREVLERSFEIKYLKDWSYLEEENNFLEGTGSMVMDHVHRIIYACLSERTKLEALDEFAKDIHYRVMPFVAETERGPIYHTNVLMSIGEGFSILCPKLITDHMERIAVAQLLEATGHENIYVEPEAMEGFACNLLQVKNKEGKPFIVISKTATEIIPAEKLQALAKYGELVAVDVSMIEKTNGGSVRCMMAEIFLPKKSGLH